MVRVVVDRSVCTNSEMPCRLNRVDVCTEEQKLPAILFLLTLNHFLDLLAVITAACILHAVRCDDEQSMFRDIFISCVLVDISNVMNRSADSIQKRGAAANGIVLVGHRLDLLNRYTVMNNLAHVVKEDSRDQCLTILLFLLFNHGVEATDGVCFQPENGKIGVCIMKDLTRWGRDYLQVGNAMEIFRRNNVRFIAVNNGIDSEKPDTLEFAPFINIMSEWYAKDISKKVKTGIKTKGMSGKPIVTEAPYGYVKDPDNKDFWIIDEEAAEVVRLIFRLFIGGKNRNQIAVYLTQEQIPTPTFYMKDRGRGTCKNKALNEDNRYKWNKVTLTHILTRQEYCGDVVNFKTTKHFRDKRNHYVDRSQWQITENVHEPIIDRADFETAQRILENAPVRRPNGDGEIHPLSGLLFCKDCGAKMHIRIDYRNGGKRHVAYCSEYHKGKAKNPKCHSPHIIDADLLMQTVAEVLKKIEDYSISNRAEFEALVKKNLAMQQTDQTKKQQKRIPQITTRLEQIDKVLNKLYEDNALGTIPQDRYEQMSQKYSEEYYTLKTELATLQEQLSAYENAGGRAQKFLKLTERYAAFTDLTPAILNEFISRIEVHERDKKRAKQAVQHIGIYFNYIGRFENEVTQLAEPTEQEVRQMREEIEEAQKEKSRAYHRQYSREYRARNLEKQREYDRMKAREYRARRKAQAAAAAPAQ